MIDKSSPLPLYAQVKADLLKKIDSGEYAEGARLPTEMELTAEYGVGRVTVRTALGELEDEKRIEKRRGVGTFVAERKIQLSLEPIISISYMLDKLGMTIDNNILNDCDCTAEQDFLRPYWESDFKVHRLTRLRDINNYHILIEDSYFDAELYKNSIRKCDKTKPVSHAFLYSNDISVERITHNIYIREPSEDEAKTLALTDGGKVVVLDRWLLNEKENRPLSFVRLVIGEKYLAVPFAK